jgi:hypothetical protein
MAFSQYLSGLSNDGLIPGCRKTGNAVEKTMSKKPTSQQKAAFLDRHTRILEGFMSGRLPPELVADAFQRIFEGEFPLPKTLAAMIAATGFAENRFNGSINERNFPLKKEGAFDASGLSLFGGDREWSIAGVKAEVEVKGGRIEGLVRGLAYLKANPDALKDGPIVFGASSWVDVGSVLVPCAYLDGGEPCLGLDWGGPEGRWGRHFRFLVSRE